MKKKATYKHNYYDETGKRRGKTFSAPTRALARLKAAQWENERSKEKKPAMAVSGALQAYLDAKGPVLSPSTLRSYLGMQKKHFDSIADRDIWELTTSDLQSWASDLILSGLSVKTAKNCYGFLSAALSMQDESLSFRVRFPQTTPYEGYCPSDDDIAVLLAAIRTEGDDELMRAVMLAAFGTMRRSEICGLTSDDVVGNTVYVKRALVKTPDGTWETKAPKTPRSFRAIEYPDFVIKELSGITGRIVPHTPDYIGDKFRRIVAAAGLPHFRFHDLRHYGASIMLYMGISRKTAELRGGWSPNSTVLQRVYQNEIDSETRRETAALNAHFERFSGI